MRCFSYRGRAPLPVQMGTYVGPDGPPAMWIGEGENHMTLSVNLVELGFDKPAPGFIYVKDYGHVHDGLADALVEQGVCELVTRVAINPYGSKIAIMRVLP